MICCLDADTLVEENYLSAFRVYFTRTGNPLLYGLCPSDTGRSETAVGDLLLRDLSQVLCDRDFPTPDPLMPFIPSVRRWPVRRMDIRMSGG